MALDDSVIAPDSPNATSSQDTLEFVIEQIVGAGIEPKSVTLSDHDAPFGAPRKGGMFNLGGRNEKHVVRLDGRQTPIIHTRHTVWSPAVIKGHLRDHFTGQDGHGQAIVDTLQDILDDQLPVKLTCGPWTWTAFPDEFTLPVEGLNDFTYELKFEVLSRPGQKQQLTADIINPFPTDLTSEIQQLLAEQAASLLVLQLAADTQIALATMTGALDASLSQALLATSAFENAGLPGTSEALAMAAAAAQVTTACDDLSAELEPLDPGTALTSSAEDAIAAWQAQQFAMLMQIEECRSRMWQVAFTANKRVRSVSKVYVVQDGDTPDSIALAQLGSAARAADLHVRQQDLVVGRRIRIPKS